MDVWTIRVLRHFKARKYHAWNSLKFINKASSVHNRIYSFMMNIIEKIFDIRSCTEILANDIEIYTIYQSNVLQLIKNYKVYILGDLHSIRAKTGIDIWMTYSETIMFLATAGRLLLTGDSCWLV